MYMCVRVSVCASVSECSPSLAVILVNYLRLMSWKGKWMYFFGVVFIVTIALLAMDMLQFFEDPLSTNCTCTCFV